MDGSQKIPQRWLNSLLIHENNQTQHPILTLGLAGWMHYAKKHSDVLNDPLQNQIHNTVVHCSDGESVVNALLGLGSIFPKQLVQNSNFVAHLLQAYELIGVQGARKAVEITVERIKG